MASALIHLHVDNNCRDRSILTDMAILRKEGLATDTRVIVMEEAEGGLKKSCTNPILAHSVFLAAASPALAALLASVGEASEEFTLVLVGVERTQAEQAVKDIYLGKNLIKFYCNIVLSRCCGKPNKCCPNSCVILEILSMSTFTRTFAFISTFLSLQMSN